MGLNSNIKKKTTFKIVKASLEDGERIEKFMDEAFIKYEPLSVSLGMKTGNWLEEGKVPLSEGLSVMAVSLGEDGFEEGTILGVCINGEISKDDSNNLDHRASTCKDPKSQKIWRLLATMERRANIWERFGISRGMEMFALAVHVAATGRGIGRALIERSRDLAIENGFQILRGDCTSSFSAKIAEQLGMECVFSVPYDQYKGEDGQIVFRPMNPHTHYRLFILRLTEHCQQIP